MELASKFSEIAPAIRSGLDNLEKWYRKTDQTDAYFICLSTYQFDMRTNITDFRDVLVLDPNIKLAYAQDKWDFEATQDGIACLEAAVCHTPNSSHTQLIYITQFDKYYTPRSASLLETVPSAVGKPGVIM